jgi:hypothetical protein
MYNVIKALLSLLCFFPPRVDRRNVMWRLTPSLNENQKFMALLTHEPGRAVTLGRAFVLTGPSFNDLFIERGYYAS